MKKNILIIVPSLPFPINSGGRMIQFEVNNYLKDVHNLSIIFPLKKDQEFNHLKFAELLPGVKLIPFFESKNPLLRICDAIRRYRSLIDRVLFSVILSFLKNTDLDSLLGKESTLYRSRDKKYPIGFVKHIKNTLKTSHFDFVQIEFHQLVSFYKYIPETSVSIFIDHEIRFIREERELSLYSFNSIFFKNLFLKNKAFEVKSVDNYDIICALSEVDSNILSNSTSKPTIYTSPISLVSKSAKYTYNFNSTLVFLGGEDHLPNKEGVDWFLTNCWTTLLKNNLDLTFNVIGKWSDATKSKYEGRYNAVRFIGFVDDIAQEIKNSIFIVPIRIGSGIRMKIIDAINIGVPFVTTSVGVEGLDFHDGFDCLIADNADDFINKILKLTVADGFSELLIANAKLKLESKYNRKIMIEKRLALYS